MKLVVDDDPAQMRKRFCFLVTHEEMAEYAFGIKHVLEGGDAIGSTLLLLIRIYTAYQRGTDDASVRVQMRELQNSLRADPQHEEGQSDGGVPLLPDAFEEDYIDAEFTDECGDEAGEKEGETE
jgi:hypothetical protein